MFNSGATLIVTLTSTEEHPPGPLDDPRSLRQYSGNDAPMKHGGHTGGEHRHQVSTDTVHDGLEDHETLKSVHSLVEHHSSETGNSNRLLKLCSYDGFQEERITMWIPSSFSQEERYKIFIVFFVMDERKS